MTSPEPLTRGAEDGTAADRKLMLTWLAGLTPAELNDFISDLSEAEMRAMLTYIAGYSPDAFTRALWKAAS